jgi:hypothetical protein
MPYTEQFDVGLSCLVVRRLEASAEVAVLANSNSDEVGIICEADAICARRVDVAQQTLYHGTAALHKYSLAHGH